MSSSYPEGNFGGNQLLDGSISLPPLYPSQMNDLHVNITTGLHQSLLLASSCSGIVHHLSGPNKCACTQTLCTSSRSVDSAPTPGWISPVSFLAPHRFQNPSTRTHVRLLGPCFKTGQMESPQTNTSSVQVHDGPPHGCTLHSSTTATAKQ